MSVSLFPSPSLLSFFPSLFLSPPSHSYSLALSLLGPLLDSLPPGGGFDSPCRTTHPSLFLPREFSLFLPASFSFYLSPFSFSLSPAPLPTFSRGFLSFFLCLTLGPPDERAFSPRCPRGTPLGYFQAICFVNARNLDRPPPRCTLSRRRLPRSLRPPERDPRRTLSRTPSLNIQALAAVCFPDKKKLPSRSLISVLVI